MSLQNSVQFGDRLRLADKTVDNSVLGFLFCQTQRHELHELFAGDLTDGGLVNERSVRGIGANLRHGADRGGVHDNGVAFGVTGALAVAVDIGSPAFSTASPAFSTAAVAWSAAFSTVSFAPQPVNADADIAAQRMIANNFFFIL